MALLLTETTSVETIEVTDVDILHIKFILPCSVIIEKAMVYNEYSKQICLSKVLSFMAICCYRVLCYHRYKAMT